LEEGGRTALGPAIVVAIMMASKVPASKVVMCTDGLANIGLGNLDTESADLHAEASQFYSQLADKARDSGFVHATRLISVFIAEILVVIADLLLYSPPYGATLSVAPCPCVCLSVPLPGCLSYQLRNSVSIAEI